MANNSVKSITDFKKKAYLIQELISTSYHEAGHTIYGLLRCMKIECVYVFEDKKIKRINGFTYYNSPTLEKIKDFTLLSDRINAEIGLAYSGLIAEKYYFKIGSGSERFPIFLRQGSSNDTYFASKIIKKYNLSPSGKKRFLFKKKIIKDVQQELQENWNAVILVAHALFKNKKLSYLELKELLTKKASNKEFWKKQFEAISYQYDNASTLEEKDFKYMLGI